MFTQSVRLGRIIGIPVGVNYSWFIVFALVTLTLGGQFAFIYPDWPTAVHYSAGIITSLLFFLSVLLHELGHSIAAKQKGINVRAITLFIFGGVAQITREPDRPMTEFYIAIMGPVTSIMLAGLFAGIAFLFQSVSEVVVGITTWLARINFILVLFNMIPGFPLDGGRVFRAIVWYYLDSYERATRIASGVGQFIAYLFIIGGIFLIVSGYWVNGLWIAFIGWFLLTAAQQVGHYVTLKSALRGIKARDIMQTDCPRVESRTTVAELVDEYVFRTGRRAFLIMENETLTGLVTLHQIKQVPRQDWHSTLLGTIMTPFNDLHWVNPDTEISTVLDIMNAEDVSQVPVVHNGKLEGIIGRNHLLQVVKTRLDFGY
jgi:Zn-dependent protease/predicted transcriptional regulator